MLVQLAVHIFVLVALKLFLIHYCIIFLIIILKFSIKKVTFVWSYTNPVVLKLRKRLLKPKQCVHSLT